LRKLQSILVTGGSGFIGTNFIHQLLDELRFDGLIVNVDKLTYAGNPLNLKDIEHSHGPRHYVFHRADICDQDAMTTILRRHDVDTVVHFAAESHVDRSIRGPREFIQTNILGTFTLLEAAREVWRGRKDVLFHHVSTDEVFGSLGAIGAFTEATPYDPRSPYSASKASSDHLVRAEHHTYGLPVTVSNCSNNYGPYQFPEKLIPLMVQNMLEGKALPVYGDGRNVRDWLYVGDHSTAIWDILQRGGDGETYAVGGENEWENIRLLTVLCEKVAALTGKEPDHYKGLITFVKDRPGHDRRYAIDCGKIKSKLGWKQAVGFEEGLERTVGWYMDNQEWVKSVKTGEYLKWIERNYGQRGEHRK
jgi:dTDP-glucose 4,6-dehydratase